MDRGQTGPIEASASQKGTRSSSSPNHRGGTVGTGFIYVGLGRKGGIRPGDLVGLIANESNLSGREIGPIKIAEQFSIVGVPEARVDDVIASLRGTLLKGKRPNARRYAGLISPSRQRHDLAIDTLLLGSDRHGWRRRPTAWSGVM